MVKYHIPLRACDDNSVYSHSHPVSSSVLKIYFAETFGNGKE